MSISTTELLNRIVTNMRTESDRLSEEIRVHRLDDYNVDRLLAAKFIHDQHVAQLEALAARPTLL